MGNSSSSLPFSVDEQVGAPHDHNGWALHKGKSTDGSKTEVSVFVGKKPLLSKTPVDRRQAHKTQLEPALHHYEYCRKLRHPHILKVYATLDTDNPSSASISGKASSPSKQQQSQSQQSTVSKNGTGDLMVVTEPCIPLSEWLLGAVASGRPQSEQLAWGLECVIEGLSFLHTSAKLAHGCISPQSLYVTPSGDVKLWNFSLITPVGPNVSNSIGGPDGHFLEWESVCCPESYRSQERVEQKWDAVSNTGGIHAMDSYSLGVLIGDYWYRNASNVNSVPQTLQKAVQRLTTSNIKMRPRVQPLLKCPAFDTPYRKLQRSLGEISIQPVEQKIQLWQNLGQQMQQQANAVPKDVALYKVLPLIFTTIRAITDNNNLLSQDMYRREVLAMMAPLFFIEEHYQDPQKVGDELSPLVAKLFLVPDRGVRSVLLNQVGFFTQNINKNSLNTSVFEPLCSGFNDSSPVLRELTLKATHALLPSLHPHNVEKLSRYLVRLQSDAETSLRTNAVIFIAKIAPHLSEVSKQKMLLPAYVRSMKDPFSPCRLSALKSTMKSKTLFTKQDLATKVMPSVMLLLLDPMTDIRLEAFLVVRELLEDLQQESNRMTELGDPLIVGMQRTASSGGMTQRSEQKVTVSSNATTDPNSASRSSVVNTSSNSSGGYLSGISSWMTSSSPAPASAVNQTTILNTQQARPIPQPPVQQFATASLNRPPPAPVVDDGWGDESESGWDDAEDDNHLSFSNIGGGNQPIKPTMTMNNTSSIGGFSDCDDPFASLGMKTSTGFKPRQGVKKGKLSMPQKIAPAKKLTLEANDVGDGWDDF